MQKLNCSLTNNEFYLSSFEQNLYLDRSLELPKHSEIERLRRVLSLVPLPSFEKHASRKDKNFFLNAASFSFPISEATPFVDGFFDSVFNLKEFYLSYLSEFDFSQIINLGEPLLYGCYNVKNSYDCNFCIDCDDCYECVSCFECTGVNFSRLVNSCRESYFLDNCFDCENCLFCSNLSEAKFHVFNKQVSEQEYFSALSSLDLDEAGRLQTENERFQNFLNIQPFYQVFNQTGFKPGFPIGDEDESVNFYSRDCEKCSTVFLGSNLRECFESAFLFGKLNSCYSSCQIVGEGHNIKRSIDCHGRLKNLDLCISCSDSHDLFACVGLKNQSYCIFNRQFRRADYLKVRKEIDEVCEDEGIFGLFLPAIAKILPYNKSLASLFFPLNQIQADLMGFSWEPDKVGLDISKLGQADLICEIMGIPFEISEGQIEFCRKHGFALPTRSPIQRMQERLARITPANVRAEKCAMSGEEIKIWSNENRQFLSKILINLEN